MATLLAHFCIKNNRQDLLALAIPLGFVLDFAIMYSLFTAGSK